MAFDGAREWNRLRQGFGGQGRPQKGRPNDARQAGCKGPRRSILERETGVEPAQQGFGNFLTARRLVVATADVSEL
jgi:hypothetical protein